MKAKKISMSILQIVCWGFSIVVLVPFVLIILNSLKPAAEAAFFSLELPKELKLDNYVNAFVKGNMLRGYVNSSIIAIASTIISNVTAAMAAFILVRSVNRLNKALYSYFFFGVVAITNMVSTMLVMSRLHMTNSILGATLLTATQGISFSMLLFTGFIKGIPRELDEAAAMDGATGWKMFFRTIFPLLKPVTMTGIILNFMGAWNGFESQLYLLTDSKKWGVMLSMYGVYGEFSSPWSTDWGLICAYIVLTMAPVIIIYLIGQRYIIEGMTAGAVKG